MFPSVTPSAFLLAMRWGLVPGGPFPRQSARRVDRRQPGIHPHQAAAPHRDRGYRLYPQPLTARHHLPHDPRWPSSSAGPGRLAEVRTLSGVIRATGLAIIGLIAGLQVLDAMGFNLAPLLASAGVAGSRHRPGCAKHRQRYVQRHPDPRRGPVQRGRHRAPRRAYRHRGSNDPAQDHRARRRRNSLHHSQLADHHRGQPERRLSPWPPSTSASISPPTPTV